MRAIIIKDGKNHCSKCKDLLPIELFGKVASSATGFKSRCKSCVREDSKKYNSENIDVKKESSKRYYDKNPEKERLRKSKFYSEDKEKVTKWNKDWVDKNKDRYDAYREVYQEVNKDLIKVRQKVWRNSNKDKTDAKNARRRSAKLNRSPVWATGEDSIAIITVYKIARRISEVFGGQYHVDHIIPLQGKLVSGLHCIGNLQIIPAKHNISKSKNHEVLI